MEYFCQNINNKGMLSSLEIMTLYGIVYDVTVATYRSCMQPFNYFRYGVIDVKPLGVIWGKYSQWSEKNTIMFDDIRRNFIMNPQSGLKVKCSNISYSFSNWGGGSSEPLLCKMGVSDKYFRCHYY